MAVYRLRFAIFGFHCRHRRVNWSHHQVTCIRPLSAEGLFLKVKHTSTSFNSPFNKLQAHTFLLELRRTPEMTSPSRLLILAARCSSTKPKMEIRNWEVGNVRPLPGPAFIVGKPQLLVETDS